MKYWIYRNKQMEGPFEVAELWKLDGFSLSSIVAREGEMEWVESQVFPEITQYAVFDKLATSAPQIIESGDTAALVRNWRQAVVQSNAPEAKPLPVAPTAVPAAPKARAPLGRKFRQFRALSMQFWKRTLIEPKKDKWVLLSLWTLFGALYFPRVDQVESLMFNMAAQPTLEAQPGRVRWFTQWRSRIRTPGNIKTGKSEVSAKKPADKIVDVEVVNLGGGTTLKTVVTLVERNGVKTYHTQRLIRTSPRGRFQPE
jgi:hypothetical protein